MKLQTRIIIGFLMVILVPLLLFMATLIGFGYFQANQGNGVQTADTAYDLSIAESNDSTARVQLMTKDVLFMILVILVFTSVTVGSWLYRSVAVPLVKLKNATNNIKEGNLEFTMDVEGNDEFAELCRDFEEMRIRLKESTEEKIVLDKDHKELISNISHDLKTPITAVKGYVEGIMDGVADTPEKMERYIRTIYNKTTEMDHLINELTFYSKIDTNRIPYTFSKICVNEYFNDCAEELELELEVKGIELVYANHVGDDVMIIADGEQLMRVVNNIVSNAVKYMNKEHGIIQIRIKDVGDFIQVEIEDNGKGIAAKDLANIFDRFYRTDVSRNSSKGGSGIGLSIVKKIMEDHGGKVWASSKEGIGTIMYFVLRKYQEVPADE
ncbi:MAG: HAMP domain-containing histidine kinase [Lachnospiraceae bacterium]|nr:HAMP domain-containing histidine kinase [Lachnospiraceae bacterium]MCI9100117.1 HAMP domain-containing histidine kinase [Lachnospiraceae bacterium]MCI9358854.1 HAMP domain-containing histidine kinase [Lachnospiraceae bacterium]